MREQLLRGRAGVPQIPGQPAPQRPHRSGSLCPHLTPRLREVQGGGLAEAAGSGCWPRSAAPCRNWGAARLGLTSQIWGNEGKEQTAVPARGGCWGENRELIPELWEPVGKAEPLREPRYRLWEAQPSQNGAGTTHPSRGPPAWPEGAVTPGWPRALQNLGMCTRKSHHGPGRIRESETQRLLFTQFNSMVDPGRSQGPWVRPPLPHIHGTPAAEPPLPLCPHPQVREGRGISRARRGGQEQGLEAGKGAEGRPGREARWAPQLSKPPQCSSGTCWRTQEE